MQGLYEMAHLERVGRAVVRWHQEHSTEVVVQKDQALVTTLQSRHENSIAFHLSARNCHRTLKQLFHRP